jgi:hypothetical protein
MALVSRNIDRIPFSLRNHPIKPTIVWFTVASAPELNAYKARSSSSFKARPDGTMVVSAEQTRQNLEAQVEFAVSRIAGVDEFEVLGADGAPVLLSWPKDKAQIVEEFQRQTAAWTLFVRTVEQYHGASDGDTLAAIYAEGDPSGN